MSNTDATSRTTATSQTTTLKPCPFCGGEAKITKHFKEDMWRLLHRCPVVGAITLEWTAPEYLLAKQWNKRAEEPSDGWSPDYGRSTTRQRQRLE